MIKVIVTGGAGFIGSHLCERLIHNGFNVVCIDNLYTGSLENIKSLSQFPNFKFIKYDVVENTDIEGDVIFHLACPASPRHYQKDPIFTVKTSFLGSLNMLEVARKCSAKIIFTSTSEVYGDPNVHPQNEGYWGNVNPIGIRSCYDEGKRVAETLFFDYMRTYGTNIRVARLFNTYGPRMQFNDGRVVSNFIVQALSNQNITVYGDGSQTRSFCYVSDTVSGLYKLMEASSFTGPVNIGNPNEIKIIELTKKIIELSNSSSNTVFCDIPQDDPKKRKPDISLAKSVLNWDPHISLDEGLNITIDDFRKRLNLVKE